MKKSSRMIERIFWKENEHGVWILYIGFLGPVQDLDLYRSIVQHSVHNQSLRAVPNPPNAFSIVDIKIKSIFSLAASVSQTPS
jgi:hypothetical protein